MAVPSGCKKCPGCEQAILKSIEQILASKNTCFQVCSREHVLQVSVCALWAQTELSQDVPIFHVTKSGTVNLKTRKKNNVSANAKCVPFKKTFVGNVSTFWHLFVMVSEMSKTVLCCALVLGMYST